MPVNSGSYGDFATAKRRRERLASRKAMKWARIKADFARNRSTAITATEPTTTTT